MRHLLARIAKRLRPQSPKPLVLMYHRVAHPPVDPWGLAVHPDRFADHLAVLRASRSVLVMSEFVERAQRGTLPRNAVAITFDDGYADTLRQAKPLLASAGIPATLFLTTAFVGQCVEYWWDELARSILERDEALDDHAVIAGEACRLKLNAVKDAAAGSAAWRAWNAPRTERETLYYALWTRLRPLPAGDCAAAMAQLRAALKAPPPERDNLPMTASEVGELAADRLFEIGGHTATHVVLPALGPAERRREIRGGKVACERLTGRPATGFAYPHGANDPDSRAAVAECGFHWACTTQSRPIAAAEPDWYGLPRIQVLNVDAPAFERQLQMACA